jgi:hypothetical protein
MINGTIYVARTPALSRLALRSLGEAGREREKEKIL